MKKLLSTILSLGLFISSSLTVLAFSGDMAINQQSIRFSTSNFLEGRTVRIYASVTNSSPKDLLGVVRYYDNDNQIAGDQAISIFGNKTDDVFVDWTPGFGNHKIAVKIFPWEPTIDDPSNNWIVDNIYVVQDTDHDGIPNDTDDDDDGDGVNDDEDDFPLNPNETIDTDGDSIGDNTDKDDDNDDVPDDFDDLPLDPNETIDTDGDGIGNIADDDDDGDGISDAEEENQGLNPVNSDTDNDGVNDNVDDFPLNPEEQLDTDNDGLGNNIDTDDDNDNILDQEDEFPLNQGPEIKLRTELQNAGLLEKTQFDASLSLDNDGEIVSYLWEFDGEKKEGNSVEHVFRTPGDHDVKLTITDDSGQSVTKDFQVSVLNLRLYKQLLISLVVILLAILIYFKYIAEAEKSHKPKK